MESAEEDDDDGVEAASGRDGLLSDMPFWPLLFEFLWSNR
jgi:hypothetical protein